MGLRIMPSARQLEDTGRRDLVAAVRRAGGFLEVAQALGLRSQRKPAGFWDDEMNLGGWAGALRGRAGRPGLGRALLGIARRPCQVPAAAPHR